MSRHLGKNERNDTTSGNCELLVNEKEGSRRPFLFTYINNCSRVYQASSPLAEILPNLYWNVTFTSLLV